MVALILALVCLEDGAALYLRHPDGMPSQALKYTYEKPSSRSILLDIRIAETSLAH